MERDHALKRLKMAISSTENRPRIFYFLAFIPLIAIIYFHFEWPSAMVIPFYGFVILAIKKPRLFSYREAKLIQRLFGLLIIISSPFIHLALLPFFPFLPLAIYYGSANYAAHILGLFLVFFNITALREAFTPVFLIIAASAGPMVSRWAEFYFKPLVPFFTSLIVAIINAVGIKAKIPDSDPNTVILYTPNRPVMYQIVWACIGFESAFVFALVLIILLFEGPGSKKAKILWSAIGLLGTFLLNLLRVVLIFVTEYFYTTEASAEVHNFAGYILLFTWITVFLYIYSKREGILRKFQLLLRI